MSNFSGINEVIDSIEYDSIILNGVTSNTKTITTANKAILIFLGFESDANDIKTFPRITLTNPTTITANRNAGVGSITTVNYALIRLR